LKNAKISLIEAKIYKLTASMMPHKPLFQHQLGHVWPTI